MKPLKNFLSPRGVLAALSLAGLSACAMTPYPGQTSTILSRLPASAPGAAPANVPALTPAEKQRYDEIDKQVMSDQARNQSAQQAYDAWGYGYGGWYPGYTTYYPQVYGGGWYGDPGWGYGYGSYAPGWSYGAGWTYGW